MKLIAPPAVLAVLFAAAIAPAIADEPATPAGNPNGTVPFSSEDSGKGDSPRASSSPRGALLGKSLVQHVKIGVVITADTGPCRGITATAPVPMDWPEQKVKVEKEDTSPNVQKIHYRTLGGTVRQMIVTVPKLQKGEVAHAYATFEITRNALLPPTDPTAYKLLAHPEKKSELANYLAPSPFIESRNEKIMALAKEVTAGKEDWAKVEAIYDAGQKRLTFREAGPIKGALEALEEGTGHCEEFSSLFIAMCRAQNIPARTVWVPEHCYSEFYMVDAEGHGYWFPVQSAGDRSFGGIPETRYILQKGDNFHDPDRPSHPLRYVAEFMKGVGSSQPKCEFSREAAK